MNPKHIFIIAGESSGDQHAANYVKEHKKLNPNIYFSGLWQPYRRAARFQHYVDTVDVRARWDIEGIIINFE